MSTAEWLQLADYLIENGFKGRRLLLLLPSSLEYVTAFIGFYRLFDGGCHRGSLYTHLETIGMIVDWRR